MTPRLRLYRDSLDRLASLSSEAALGWLDVHGPPAGDDRRDEASLPEPLRRLLQRRRQQILAANLHRIVRYQELVEVLGDRGIPVCPLKGISVLGTVYRDDPESRPMCDLDLLVRTDDADAAVAALEASLDLAETRLSRRLAMHSHERVLVGPALVVEIHTRLGLRTGRAGTWQDLEPMPGRLHDREAHLLDRETTLAYAIAHFVQHVPWSRRVWVEDILRLSLRGFDSRGVIQRSRSLACRRLVIAGVRALRARLGSLVLPGLPDRDRGLGRILSSVYAALGPRLMDLGSPSDGAPRPTSRWQRHLSTFLLADRVGDLLAFLRTRSRHETLVAGDS